MNTERLQQQIQFVIEIDKLKGIIRRSYLVDGSRRENSAEHSWHLAVMGLLLTEHANEQIDILRVLKMLLVHDIVEIDADDTFCYDDIGALTKAAREVAAADRIFSLLPVDQAVELRDLWEEFELRATDEAKFAMALDRLMPLLHNYLNQGRSWQEHGVTGDRILERNQLVGEGSVTLWEYAETFIREAIEKGYVPAASEVKS